MRRRIFVFNKITETLEDYCIKFCEKLGDSQMEMTRMTKQAFGSEAMGTT